MEIVSSSRILLITRGTKAKLLCLSPIRLQLLIIITGILNVRKYELHISSCAAFDAEYGLDGLCLIGSYGPYTSSVDICINDTKFNSLATSSILIINLILLSMKDSGV